MDGAVDTNKLQYEEDDEEMEDTEVGPENGIVPGMNRMTEAEEEPVKRTVVEYLKNMEGDLDNDAHDTPLIYGIERTTKSEEDGLYFVLTHKAQQAYARRVMKTEFTAIYQGSVTHDSSMKELHHKFGSPYLGSYQ